MSEDNLKTSSERVVLLETLILSHNKEMDDLCNNKKNCGYENYKRDCPSCPKDYKICLEERTLKQEDK